MKPPHRPVVSKRKRVPSGEYLALAVAGVEGVHGGVQARLLGWRGVVEEVCLVRRAGLFKAEEHDDLREHNGSLPAVERGGRDLFSSTPGFVFLNRLFVIADRNMI